jgi:hypothetical protein
MLSMNDKELQRLHLLGASHVFNTAIKRRRNPRRVVKIEEAKELTRRRQQLKQMELRKLRRPSRDIKSARGLISRINVAIHSDSAHFVFVTPTRDWFACEEIVIFLIAFFSSKICLNERCLLKKDE